jgi:ribosome biogenesis GTPase
MNLPETSASPLRVSRVDRGQVVFRAFDGGELVIDRNDLHSQDWVTGDLVEYSPAVTPAITALARTSLLRRTRNDGTEQAIVANVDTVFLVIPQNEGDRPSVLERLAVIGWDSGATPLIVITKSDLADTARRRAIENTVMRACPGVEWLFTSAQSGEGLEDMRSRLVDGSAAVMIGHSGVGKSRLINELSNGRNAATTEVRARDSKGRHTTTNREVVPIDGTTAIIIDTPGVRELGIPADAEAVADVFPEIEALARTCRFKDCSHQRDQGCEVQVAVREGAVDPARVRRYIALQRESAAGGITQLGRRDKTREYTRFAREYREARGR